MLFNSYSYLLMFLPIVVGGYYALLPLSANWRVICLAVASLCFYADWAPRYLPLLLVSALFNFGLGKLLETKKTFRSLTLRVGIVGNLALLVVFKYTNFIVAQLDLRFELAIPQTDIALPIGISFFTFTQIAYLVDLSRGICGRYDLWRYVLFVSFFPHLLAGPILHHREMMPQFARRLLAVTYERQFGYGLLILSIGLFKKVCLADSVAPYANAAFDAVDHGVNLSSAAAWWGALAYTFQLYFDFSGYSDMAIGIARLFGDQAAAELQRPLSRGEHHRVLAALAHDIVALSARLPLFFTRRQPPWRDAPIRQPAPDNDARRHLARGRLWIRALGPVARPVSDP